ncbi:MAG: M23 family metallopeptidase [Campylobacterales bacterium]|nr:M23 family metallopeptidase [Campylobacterales bacterium]
MEFRKKQNSGAGKYLSILILLIIISGAGYIKFSPEFEQDKPEINIDDQLFWNLETKLKIQLSDQSGIKYYKVSFNDGTKDIELDSKILTTPAKILDLEVKPPKLDMFFKGTSGTIKVEAFDNSKWNYLEGNHATKEVQVAIDKKRPVANVISNSLAIRHGGSALAVVQVKDENLQDAYITLNDKIKFDLIPFYKDSYFVSLIAWPINIDDFKRVSLVATDKAGNITKTKIPLYIRDLKVKKDTIVISDKFINNVSTNVLTLSGTEIPSNLSQRFIKQNRLIRDLNINMIKQITDKYMNRDLIENFKINIFKRLKGSRTAAGFAEHRYYTHNNEQIDDAWHLGMDWASVKKAPVKISNPGTVIFNEYLGIYGNTIIVDHGMGLSTLYAHISSSDVNTGDQVSQNQKIAHTGATGAVLGDHLHFGVLVQGIEVNPKEWMDRNWIKTRITKVLDEARKTIDSK